MSELARATPAEHPCFLHPNHTPHVLETQGHHVFPVALQAEVWPDVDRDVPASVKVKTIAWICGTGHDNAHVLIRAMLKGGVIPTKGKHFKEWALATAAVNAFNAAKADPSAIPVVEVPRGR